MTFGKKKLSMRQIKKIERTKEEFLEEVDQFITRISLQKSGYYQNNKILYCKQYNKEGVKKLKTAINDMDLEHGIIAGETINLEENLDLANTNLVQYIGKIEEIIIQEFGALESPMKEKTIEYMAEIYKILTQKIKPLFK